VKVHEKYIKRCLQLAKNGKGLTYPNPMVGSVVVYNNQIIGEGWHQKAGEAHAEVNAIASVRDKRLLKKATIYVSLEPCNHVGKTPPCSDLIIAHNIPNVVVGCVDPYEKVAGKGIEKLRKNGCDVLVGVLEKECVALNRRFFTYHKEKRPYVLLKWAETQEGFISPVSHRSQSLGTIPKGEEASPVWISNAYSQQLVHKWRAEEQAILVGTTTAIADNPKLDVRSYTGESPIRIVLDRELRIPADYHLFDKRIKTIVLTEKEVQLDDGQLIFELVDFSSNLASQICSLLFRYKIQSLIVEGGQQTLQTFIDANLWDEARVFIGETSFAKGVKGPELKGKEVLRMRMQSDILKIIENW